MRSESVCLPLVAQYGQAKFKIYLSYAIYGRLLLSV